MANKLVDEDRIFQLIEKGEATIHPEVWKLLSHHIGNDLQAIYISLQVLLSIPAWILNTASFVINFLCLISFRSKRRCSVTKVCNNVFTRARNIDFLVNKLRFSLNKSKSFIKQEAGCK